MKKHLTTKTRRGPGRLPPPADELLHLWQRILRQRIVPRGTQRGQGPQRPRGAAVAQRADHLGDHLTTVAGENMGEMLGMSPMIGKFWGKLREMTGKICLKFFGN